MSSRGIHLLADLYGCVLTKFAPSPSSLDEVKQFVSSVLRAQGLKELGNYYHFFCPHAVTATICLAESHLAFHSWPEDAYVSMDIFVCNRSVERHNEAHTVVSTLSKELFFAEEIRLSPVERSIHPRPLLRAMRVAN